MKIFFYTLVYWLCKRLDKSGLKSVARLVDKWTGLSDYLLYLMELRDYYERSEPESDYRQDF